MSAAPPRRQLGGDRPRFNDRNDRGPRPEGGFGGGDRPRFNRDERGPRPERSFGDRPRREEGGFGQADRPRFNDAERGPRREGGFGGDRPVLMTATTVALAQKAASVVVIAPL